MSTMLWIRGAAEVSASCQNCRWWCGEQCHFSPPACDSETGSAWPTTKKTDFCGKFEASKSSIEDYDRAMDWIHSTENGQDAPLCVNLGVSLEEDNEEC